MYRARHVVIGTGTEPKVPAALLGVEGPVVHSAEYLHRRDELVAAPSIAIVGSGQSAAEIYRDLLETVDEHEYRLDWITRSPRFFPMEYTKLTLEMTSPEYTDHFHGLPLALRERLGREQRGLYKGISGDLIDEIYDTLYRKSAARPVPTTLLTDTELVAAEWRADAAEFTLRLRHAQLDEEYERRAAMRRARHRLHAARARRSSTRSATAWRGIRSAASPSPATTRSTAGASSCRTPRSTRTA